MRSKLHGRRTALRTDRSRREASAVYLYNHANLNTPEHLFDIGVRINGPVADAYLGSAVDLSINTYQFAIVGAHLQDVDIDPGPGVNMATFSGEACQPQIHQPHGACEKSTRTPRCLSPPHSPTLHLFSLTLAPMSTTTAPHPHAVFRDLPFMGVIRVNNEAAKVGYKMGDASWTNLGQGQPEVGVLEGAPARFSELKIDIADHAYGPVEGLPELRDAIAAHYNRLYRAGKKSQYTRENVAVAPGGRAALTRLGAALAPCRLGYFTPDYTAYEDLLTAFGTIQPVHIELPASSGFRISPRELADRVVSQDLSALLISNPCNPTGVAIAGDELRAWVEMSRVKGVTLLMDEFYSHYAYAADGSPMPGIGGISAAPFVDDVNTDRVLIIDGLTKCFRYPGWRSGWVVGARDVIQKVTAAGSFLDGGPSRPMQRAAIEVLEPERADQELAAVRKAFAIKRKMTIDSLTALGIRFPAASQTSGTFYVFGDISRLARPMNTGDGFMREAFKHRVLTVPGAFFDVNPGHGRTGASPLESFVRFSFGPPKDNLAAGLERLAAMVKGK